MSVPERVVVAGAAGQQAQAGHGQRGREAQAAGRSSAQGVPPSGSGGLDGRPGRGRCVRFGRGRAARNGSVTLRTRWPPDGHDSDSAGHGGCLVGSSGDVAPPTRGYGPLLRTPGALAFSRGRRWSVGCRSPCWASAPSCWSRTAASSYALAGLVSAAYAAGLPRCSGRALSRLVDRRRAAAGAARGAGRVGGRHRSASSLLAGTSAPGAGRCWPARSS